VIADASFVVYTDDDELNKANDLLLKELIEEGKPIVKAKKRMTKIILGHFLLYCLIIHSVEPLTFERKLASKNLSVSTLIDKKLTNRPLLSG